MLTKDFKICLLSFYFLIKKLYKSLKLKAVQIKGIRLKLCN
jgi:hypothetical protein